MVVFITKFKLDNTNDAMELKRRKRLTGFD